MNFQKKHCVAMLLAGGQGSRLMVLTENTAKPAVPFGGKYRIIDFPLSNCVNSGIDTIGVLTQYQPLELNEYIGNGQPWRLNRSHFNASVLPGIESFNLQNQSIITLLKEKYDLEIHCSNRELRAVVSDETTSRLLGTPNRFPLLQVTDLKTGVWQDTKIPVEYYTFLYVTERIRYSPEI